MEGRILSEKIWFSLDYPRGNFPKKNIGQVDYYCFLLIVFEILVLLVCPGLMLCKKLSFASSLNSLSFRYLFVGIIIIFIIIIIFFFGLHQPCHPPFRFSNTPPT